MLSQHPTVTGLSAAIVSHRQWAVSRWFYANPIWYYQRPSAAHEICTGGKFYQLVDDELREVCRLLNDAGVRTTPSCQGHSYERDRFERIWQELSREQEHIRGAGLIVKDCENDQPFLFQSPHYRLPWNSFDEFFKEAGAHQNIGYLGMIFPPQLATLARLFLNQPPDSSFATVRADHELSDRLGGTLISVQVDAPDSDSRTLEWSRFTRHVRDLLNSNPHQRVAPLPECRPSAEAQTAFPTA